MTHPDQLAAANNNRDLLTAAIGPTVGYHISQCRSGGYVIVVDGVVHAACTTLVEAMAAMGRVAAAQYNETAEPPERAADVTPPAMPRHVEKWRQEAEANGGVDRVGELEKRIASRMQTTVSLVAILLTVGTSMLWGP